MSRVVCEVKVPVKQNREIDIRFQMLCSGTSVSQGQRFKYLLVSDLILSSLTINDALFIFKIP